MNLTCSPFAAQLTADGSSAFKSVLARFAPQVVSGWNYLAQGSGAGTTFFLCVHVHVYLHVCTLGLSPAAFTVFFSTIVAVLSGLVVRFLDF